MEEISRCTLGSQAHHTFFGRPYTVYPTEYLQPPPTFNTSIIFTNNYTQITVKHATYKTNGFINRATQKIQGYNITLTTTQVQEEIKQSTNNNSHGPDKLNIRDLKHICPPGLAFLTSMFETALNKNIIPHIWKLDNIVPIPNPKQRAPHTGPYASSL